jgi:hypothetical protein
MLLEVVVLALVVAGWLAVVVEPEPSSFSSSSEDDDGDGEACSAERATDGEVGRDVPTYEVVAVRANAADINVVEDMEKQQRIAAEFARGGGGGSSSSSGGEDGVPLTARIYVALRSTRVRERRGEKSREGEHEGSVDWNGSRERERDNDTAICRNDVTFDVSQEIQLILVFRMR